MRSPELHIIQVVRSGCCQGIATMGRCRLRTERLAFCRLSSESGWFQKNHGLYMASRGCELFVLVFQKSLSVARLVPEENQRNLSWFHPPGSVEKSLQSFQVGAWGLKSRWTGSEGSSHSRRPEGFGWLWSVFFQFQNSEILLVKILGWYSDLLKTRQ